MDHARRRPARLAEKLLQIRKALGLSQKEMAERLSKQSGTPITYKNVSKYECARSAPYLEIGLAYARVANVEMNQIVDDDLDLVFSGSFLIIPNLNDRNVLSTVRWLQEHLSFTDEELARLVGVSRELFSQWKRGVQTLTSEQTETLKGLSTAINRLLSFFNFRGDLMVCALEFHYVQRDRYTPPWIGASLKDYLLGHGAKGIAEVDSWVQKIKSPYSP